MPQPGRAALQVVDRSQPVALKAFSRIAEVWSLTVEEAAGLADMSVSTWKRARRPGYAGTLSRDKLLRLSLLVGIYKSLALYFDPPLAESWVSRANTGPEFDGATPVAAMVAGGLSKIQKVRVYLDALRGGA